MLPLAVLAAGALSAGASYFGSQQANSANREIANAQMAFQANQANISNDTAWDMFHGTQGFNAEQASIARDYNTQMVGRQEAFQRDMMNSAQAYDTLMSNTAWQRGVADMKAAGINPILAYSKGGATAPVVQPMSGAMGHSTSASIAGGNARPAPGGASAVMQNNMGGAVTNAIQGAKALGELEQIAANVDQTKAHTALVGEQQHATRASTALRVAEAITEGVRPDLIRAQVRTEQGRPAVQGAEIARLRSSAAHLDRDAPAQAERPAQIREETRRAGAGANVDITRNQQLREYGPPGTVSSTVGGVSTILDNIGSSFLNLFR